MNDNNNLIYEIKQIEGVEIDVLCNSLKALQDEYLRFTNNRKKIVIKEIRKGSGIFEFTDLLIVSAISFMEQSNTILQFAEYLAAVKDVILKKKEKLPNEMKLTPTTVDNLNSMCSPVMFGNNNILNINVGQLAKITVNNDDYKEISKHKKQIIKETKTINNSFSKNYIYEKVLFQWVQARFDNKKIGNQAVIKRIQEKAVKVIFADDNSETKTEMTTSTHGVDWQNIKYIVDVEIMVDNDRILAYKILKNYPYDSIIEENNNIELF